MTLQVIDTDDGTASGGYKQTVTLDGVAYRLSFTYSQREDRWYIGIATNEGESIAEGIALVCFWPLLIKCADARKPAGKLYVLPNSADDSDPGLTDFGPSGRCQLIYEPAADVAADGPGVFP